jgi:hypothetical protein
LIEDARQEAVALIEEDSELSSYPALKDQLQELQADAAAEFIDKG